MSNKIRTSQDKWNLGFLKKSLKDLKPTLSRKYKVKRIGIFGSIINGRAHTSSDVDVLVEFSRRIDLLEFVALERYLCEQTGAKIDLVSLKALRPEFKDAILNEVMYI
jgi:predicted nucleotidyltransferase